MRSRTTLRMPTCSSARENNRVFLSVGDNERMPAMCFKVIPTLAVQYKIRMPRIERTPQLLREIRRTSFCSLDFRFCDQIPVYLLHNSARVHQESTLHQNTGRTLQLNPGGRFETRRFPFPWLLKYQPFPQPLARSPTPLTFSHISDFPVSLVLRKNEP